MNFKDENQNYDPNLGFTKRFADPANPHNIDSYFKSPQNYGYIISSTELRPQKEGMVVKNVTI
ncbi:hypothetical protein RJ40_02035 [Methanofollis aquaemaris]|uniref:Uncharacterized protein n=1 Tax=Methanofollis aquaemaris TaxID=126734 RepID=A0A8A3S2Q8_9EURY|nr:hypothetical protein [Methanofollis aquaemaris]QSZ66362.1 hypothetical protein RJ40_02035 [Methanofollis aquaemaris]